MKVGLATTQFLSDILLPLWFFYWNQCSLVKVYFFALVTLKWNLSNANIYDIYTGMWLNQSTASKYHVRAQLSKWLLWPIYRCSTVYRCNIQFSNISAHRARLKISDNSTSFPRYHMMVINIAIIKTVAIL